jgi:hypothetical protein
MYIEYLYIILYNIILILYIHIPPFPAGRSLEIGIAISNTRGCYPFDNRFGYATYFLPMSPILDDITDNEDRRQRAAGSVRAPEVRILRAIEGEGESQTSEDFEVL